MSDRYTWSRLNKQQVGAYAEYFVKMELTMYGFEVYTAEVDDRGIDFVARCANGPFITVQVKSLRSKRGYVFMRKESFEPNDYLYLALCLLEEQNPPELYLIPSTVWLEPNELFADRDYPGLKSKPEWGVNVSMRNLPRLHDYRFDHTVESLLQLSGRANS